MRPPDGIPATPKQHDQFNRALIAQTYDRYLLEDEANAVEGAANALGLRIRWRWFDFATNEWREGRKP